jgi:hypothetical protein
MPSVIATGDECFCIARGFGLGELGFIIGFGTGIGAGSILSDGSIDSTECAAAGSGSGGGGVAETFFAELV